MADLGISKLVEWLGDVCGSPLGRVLKGSGHVVCQARAMGSLTGVNLMTRGDVHITLGAREELRVEAEDNLLPYLETNVSGGQLDIRRSDGVWLRPTRPIHLYLTVRSLDSLALAGSGTIEAPDLEADHFRVWLTGSGDIHLGKLDAREVQIKLPGSGQLCLAGSQAERQAMTLSGSGRLRLDHLDAREIDVRITGSAGMEVNGGAAKAQHIILTGTGSYAALNVQSELARVNITGSGSASVSVRDRIEARITGSGSVYYVGKPTVAKTVLGSGSVRPIAQFEDRDQSGPGRQIG